MQPVSSNILCSNPYLSEDLMASLSLFFLNTIWCLCSISFCSEKTMFFHDRYCALSLRKRACWGWYGIPAVRKPNWNVNNQRLQRYLWVYWEPTRCTGEGNCDPYSVWLVLVKYRRCMFVTLLIDYRFGLFVARTFWTWKTSYAKDLQPTSSQTIEG